MPPNTLQTERLNLRPLHTGDLDDLHRLFVEPGVRQFLWDDAVIPKTQTRDVLLQNEKQFASKGFGLWGAFPAGSESLVGFCGFWFFRDPPELELLYGLSETTWSRGFATEMARRMIAFGFEDLAFDGIVASTDAPNTASIRVLEKCGMKLIRRATIKGLDTVFFGIDRAAFAAHRSGT